MLMIIQTATTMIYFFFNYNYNSSTLTTSKAGTITNPNNKVKAITMCSPKFIDNDNNTITSNTSKNKAGNNS